MKSAFSNQSVVEQSEAPSDQARHERIRVWLAPASEYDPAKVPARARSARPILRPAGVRRRDASAQVLARSAPGSRPRPSDGRPARAHRAGSTRPPGREEKGRRGEGEKGIYRIDPSCFPTPCLLVFLSPCL